MQRKWILPTEREHRLGDLDLPPFVISFLNQKGFVDADSAQNFLYPQLKLLSPPEILPEMDRAVERLDAAVRRQESIVLYGDYDVDGVASLTLLRRILRAYGNEAKCFLPLRAEEGYGLSTAGLERCFQEYSPSLLIVVDCGTNSVEEVAEIRRRGVEVMILDHHEPNTERPDCVALVNPKRGSEFHYLCSAGIVFKLIHAFYKRRPLQGLDLKEYLDLVALATVADLVPLIQENRTFVRRGLKQMENTRWPGLAALMRVAGVKAPVRSSDVGFRLGPRINAAGRLGTAQKALALLLSEDPSEAARLATDLDVQNRERQAVERSVNREVDSWLQANHKPECVSIVAGSRDWHSGVLGIVASRISRRYHRPTLLVGFGSDGIGKGSGRSIEGLSLVEALRPCSHLLEKFGGHEMAAGVTIHEDGFENFRANFEEITRRLVTDELLIPRLRLDAKIRSAELTMAFLEWQDLLEPFGTSNPQPIFFLQKLKPAFEPRWMREKHLRFEFRLEQQRLQAVFF
jgi:single-stranded-DNA-specific exonuclease